MGKRNPKNKTYNPAKPNGGASNKSSNKEGKPKAKKNNLDTPEGMKRAIVTLFHNNPEKALSDGQQSITPESFSNLMNSLRIIAGAIGRNI
jgi:3-deoxy-D-manno-octulosonic acid (KDO) 8-phosphate synthase